MTARDETGIDVLDPRFPIRLTAGPHIFEQMLAQRPDRACARGVETRARTEGSHQERYVLPPDAIWEDGATHDAREDTGSIPAITHDAKVDTGVGAFIAYHDEADAEAARTRRWARTLRAGRRRRP